MLKYLAVLNFAVVFSSEFFSENTKPVSWDGIVHCIAVRNVFG